MCQKAVDIDALREKFRRTVREYVKRDGVKKKTVTSGRKRVSG